MPNIRQNKEKIQFLLLVYHFGLIRANIEKKPAKIALIPKIITCPICPLREFREFINSIFFYLVNQIETNKIPNTLRILRP